MGFDHRHYVPILKAKAGELKAMKEATDAVCKVTTPLLEVPSIPHDHINDKPSKSAEAHVDSVADAIIENCGDRWGDRNLFIDGAYVEDLDTLSDGREPIGAVLDRLRVAKMKVIPVAGLDRNLEYTGAVRSAVLEDGYGLCLRLQERDLEAEDLGEQVRSLLNHFEVKASKVDLVIDYGPVQPSRSSIVPFVNSIPMLEQWRSFTLSSSSFPENMSAVGKHSVEELPRDEWETWNFLRARSDKVVRMPSFSDYAINHPIVADLDPRQIRMTANIRYTWTASYVVARGEVFPRKNDKKTAEERRKAKPDSQYPTLAKAIMGHDAWCGQKFSWGDQFIQKCANRECVGNATNWRAVGTSHHLAFVSQQIANLP